MHGPAVEEHTAAHRRHERTDGRLWQHVQPVVAVAILPKAGAAAFKAVVEHNVHGEAVAILVRLESATGRVAIDARLQAICSHT